MHIGPSPNIVDDISRYPMKNRLVWGLRDAQLESFKLYVRAEERPRVIHISSFNAADTKHFSPVR